MNTLRTHYTIIIGSNTLPKENLDCLVGKLTHLFGGLTVSERLGTWSIDGQKFSQAYGNFASEKSFQIDLCTMPDNDGQELDKIKKACKENLQGFANWIHVESYMTHGLHFSIDAM